MEVNEQFLRRLPKCEHHVHLEGTLSPELLFQLAKHNNIALPDDFPSTPAELHARYERFTGLDDFLQFYYIGMRVLITEKDFEDLAWQYFLKCQEDGVRHAEVFFDPQGHVDRGISLDTLVKGFTRAIARAQQELGITAKLIMCLLRHLSVESGVEMVNEAHSYFRSGEIAGIGLDSTEKDMNPLKFHPIFEAARASGAQIRYTAHAGEEGPADYVWEALKELQVERIDHGINSHHDAELLVHLSQTKTLLTLCPVSNVKLRVVDSVADIPFGKFLNHGVPFSINSDDPAYFGGYCLHNYLQVQAVCNWTTDIWGQVCLAGIEGSWVDEERKQLLREELVSVLQGI
ncbi:adenine deaminase [Trichomonascus vanleenenianus]|uniref:adenine deaminase n=1 Tax=Trichomonascus vanleenenianus TaxID=2268995 RepID=UPI003ECB8142